jgi:hypothetical protein
MCSVQGQCSLCGWNIKGSLLLDKRAETRFEKCEIEIYSLSPFSLLAILAKILGT